MQRQTVHGALFDRFCPAKHTESLAFPKLAAIRLWLSVYESTFLIHSVSGAPPLHDRAEGLGGAVAEQVREPLQRLLEAAAVARRPEADAHAVR